MSDEVKLKDVTADNWGAVVDLELDAGQEDLVASNLYSLAEAQFDPDARPRAVYAGKRVVGFLMYDVQKTKGKARSLDLSVHDRPEAPGQGLRSRRAEQGAGRDQGDPRGEQDLDQLHAGKSGREAVLRQLRLRRGRAGRRRRDDRGTETVMSDGTVDPSLQRAIDALAVPGLLIGHRVISPGDELALLDEEMASISFPAIERRRASGAARIVARELMTRWALPASDPQERIWRPDLARGNRRLDGAR